MPALPVTFNGTAQDLDDFCAALGYTATIPKPGSPGETVPNPEPKAQFFARKMKEHARTVTHSFRVNRDAEAARLAALSAASPSF